VDRKADQAATIQHLANRLNVSVKTARRLIANGDIRAHRIGRQWRIFERDLDAYLATNANNQAA
jgi:excisionase family DNA binding protein